METEKDHMELGDLIRPGAVIPTFAARSKKQVLQELAGEPESALALVRKHLRPVAAPDAKRLDQLVADLDSNDFAKRQAAGDELEKLAELAEQTDTSEVCRRR